MSVTAWGGYFFPGGSFKEFHMEANGTYYKNGSFSAAGTSFEQGDRVGVAIDFGEGLAWILVNGVAIDGGDPEATTGGMPIDDIDTPLPFVGFMGGGVDMSVRIRPLEADQLYMPSGFTAWIPAGPP